MDVFHRVASWDGVEGQRNVKSFATLIAPPEMSDGAECLDCIELGDSAPRCGMVSGGVSLFEARAPTLVSVASTNAPSDILSSTSRRQSWISTSTVGMERSSIVRQVCSEIQTFWACYPLALPKDGLSRTLQLPHSFLIWGSNLGASSTVCLQ